MRFEVHSNDRPPQVSVAHALDNMAANTWDDLDPQMLVVLRGDGPPPAYAVVPFPDWHDLCRDCGSIPGAISALTQVAHRGAPVDFRSSQGGELDWYALALVSQVQELMVTSDEEMDRLRQWLDDPDDTSDPPAVEGDTWRMSLVVPREGDIAAVMRERISGSHSLIYAPLGALAPGHTVFPLAAPLREFQQALWT